jgi:tRNA-dihydrouridine synthase A
MSINGGITSLEAAKTHLEHMDGVMVGREAYQNPGILARLIGKFSARMRWMRIR